MKLYAGSSKEFIQDSIHNRIAEKLKIAFIDYYRYNPSPSEIQSWRNSLRSMSQVFQHSDLTDHGVLLEYQLPLTSKRLDCMICGRDEKNQDSAVIVELKQWEKCGPATGDNEVSTWVGGAHREVLHPSVQVSQYHQYLQDTHTAFYESSAPVKLNSCAYLHNYKLESTDELIAPKFATALGNSPLFTETQVEDLSTFLKRQLSNGKGMKVLDRIESGEYRASKKLMSHVGNIIKGNRQYILLDEQLVVYDKVLSASRVSPTKKKKTVVIVRGGPGTGKSVIAINLMADLLLNGHNAHYATGSKAFTETLRKIIGNRGSTQFKYFNSYMAAEENQIDVLIADESHRIRKSSNSRFTRKDKRSSESQLDELLRVARVSVFFIDDDQVVRPDEVGSVKYIKEAALASGADISEYTLEAQFRCAGSDGFVNWINNTLGVKRTANVLWENSEEQFDFRIFDSPFELEDAIRQKAAVGNTARLTAGFCWKWSQPNSDGTLVNDIVIGKFERPWDARPDAKKLAKGIPTASLWAHDPAGIEQVGCVYTAQGFEFDYVGVIFGKDLRFDFQTNSWIGDKNASCDTMVKRSKEDFVSLVKNTYRVLLTRGMKGCYVYFEDEATRNFFTTRMESPRTSSLKVAAPKQDYEP